MTRRSNREKYKGDAPSKILASAEEGKFPEEWCVELGISVRTLYSWADDRSEFEEAVEAAWHVLHAYWVRLLRQNLTNPALRQNSILQVMAKRFPSTWGQAPSNTLDHFLARNTVSAITLHSPSTPPTKEKRQLTREELMERIKILQDRIAARE